MADDTPCWCLRECCATSRRFHAFISRAPESISAFETQVEIPTGLFQLEASSFLRPTVAFPVQGLAALCHMRLSMNQILLLIENHKSYEAANNGVLGHLPQTNWLLHMLVNSHVSAASSPCTPSSSSSPTAPATNTAAIK